KQARGALMESLKDKVAIIGMGCTKFGENWDKSPEDLIVEAAYEAYQDAAISPADIQAAWFGTTRLNTAEPLAAALKFDYIPVTRVENLCATASDAFRNACFGIASGAYDIVLAIGVEKLKDQGMGGLGTVSGAGGNGTLEWGLSAAMFFARMATRYMHHYGLTYEELKLTLAKISVKNHHNGSLNPRAHFQREISEAQAMNAPIISWPLGLFDACGVSDGAAAAVLCRADMAKSFRQDYVLVKGFGLAVGARQGYLQPEYDMVHMEETVRASRQAYAMAGIKNPNEEIDLAEVHDCFTITELVIMEDLGFCPRGQAPEYVKNGYFNLDGRLAVNPDGGLKSFGHPIGASGLRMMYEVYKQMQGKAGPRQRKNPVLGLIHNFGMNPGSGIGSVTILGQR
ncbi:MAG TPA: acetyl-CoA acetyltransferase, partial [Dehalococcoidales bacterium]|nr:acetyl-CoA acetyltransferase [Dehalococcoidales bacterium]